MKYIICGILVFSCVSSGTLFAQNSGNSSSSEELNFDEANDITTFAKKNDLGFFERNFRSPQGEGMTQLKIGGGEAGLAGIIWYANRKFKKKLADIRIPEVDLFKEAQREYFRVLSSYESETVRAKKVADFEKIIEAHKDLGIFPKTEIHKLNDELKLLKTAPIIQPDKYDEALNLAAQELEIHHRNLLNLPDEKRLFGQQALSDFQKQLNDLNAYSLDSEGIKKLEVAEAKLSKAQEELFDSTDDFETKTRKHNEIIEQFKSEMQTIREESYARKITNLEKEVDKQALRAAASLKKLKGLEQLREKTLELHRMRTYAITDAKRMSKAVDFAQKIKNNTIEFFTKNPLRIGQRVRAAGGRVFKFIGKWGPAFLVVDDVGRVLYWNFFDADPGWTPLGYTAFVAGKEVWKWATEEDINKLVAPISPTGETLPEPQAPEGHGEKK